MSSSKLYYLYQNGNGSYTTSYNAVESLNDEQHFALVFDKNRHTIWAQGEEYGAGLAASKFNFAYSYGAPYVVSNINNEGSGKARQFVTKVSYTLNSDKFEITYSYAYESSLSVGNNTGNFVTATSVNGHHITNSYGTFETTGHSQDSEQNYVITYAYINSAGKLHYDYRNISGSQDNDNGFVYGYTQTKDGKVTVKTKSFKNSYTDNGSHNLKSYTSSNKLKNVTDAYIDKNGEIHMSYNTVYLTESEFTHHDLSITQQTQQGDTNFVYAITGISTSDGNAASHTIAYQVSGLPTKDYVDAQFKANDALRYCGTITGANSSGSIGTFEHTTNPGPGHSDPDYSAGAVYKVKTAGYFGTERVKAGDMIISYSDSATASSAVGWNVINQNIDLRQTASSSTNGDNTKRVITNVNLTGDGELTYNYSDLSISNNTQTFSAASQISDGNAQNILVSGGSKGHKVITNVSLTQDGLQTKLDVSYTYLYSERKHHSGSVGTSGGTNGPKKFVYYTSLSEDGTLSGETASLSPTLSNTANSTTETTISVGGNTSSHTIQYASNAGKLGNTTLGGLFTSFSGGGISSSDNILTQADHSITVGGTTYTAGSSTANIINSLSVSKLSSGSNTNLTAAITVNGQASADKTIAELYATYLGGVTKGGLFTDFSGGGISSDGNTLTQANHSITVGGTTKSAGSSTASIINSASVSLINTGTFQSNEHYTEIALSIDINGVTATETFNTAQLYVRRALDANFAGHADTAGQADSLSTTSKTAWGQTFWDSTGKPATIGIDKVATMPYVLFKNYNNDNLAGYCGRGSSSSNGIQLMGYSGNKLELGANNSTGMTFDTSNNIGIGTTSPGYKLDVISNTTNWAFHVFNKSTSNTTPHAAFYAAHGSGYGLWCGISSNSSSYYIADFRYGTTSDGSGGTSALYIRGDGNVGINVTSPITELQVTGQIFGYNYNKTHGSIAGSNSPAFILDKPSSYYSGIGAHGNESNCIWFGPCNYDSTNKCFYWYDSYYDQFWHFQGSLDIYKNIYMNSGQISRPNVLLGGGQYIYGRDNAVIFGATYGPSSGIAWNTVWSQKTDNGAWTAGCLSGTNNLKLVYDTDADYTPKNNNPTHIITFPMDSGTVALTKDCWNNSTTVNLTCTQSVNYSNTITAYSLMVSLSIGGVSDYSIVYDVCATFASVAGCLFYNNSFYNVGDLFSTFITQGSSIYLAENRYWGSGYYGLNCKNSDIVNVNGIFTNDYANNWTKGYCFKRSDNNYDSIWIDSSHALKFTVNGNISNASSGTNYTVLHTGNISPSISIANTMSNTSASLAITITCGGISTNYQVNDLLATFAYFSYTAQYVYTAHNADWASSAGSASTATNANNSTKWNNYSLVVTTNGSTSSMTSNNTIYMVI